MRNKLTKVRTRSACSLLAGIALAMALTLSCSDDKDDDTPSGKSSAGNSGSISSSRLSNSSSSRGGSGSSSSVEYTGGSCDINDYKTVEIGDQTWMAENYGCYVPNTDRYTTNSKCYGDDSDNCKKYGRLYNWVTAMALPSKCDNYSIYSSPSDVDCAITIPQHQGICPSGWHISNNVDWDILWQFIGCGDSKYCKGAETKLKAANGWDSHDDGSSGNGTDDYGFSALPGGYSCGTNCYIGKKSNWWSGSVYRESSSGYVTYYYTLYNYSNKTFFFRDDGGVTGDKSNYLSVRCVKNDSHGVSGGKGNDISNYRTVQIGTQTWMAENLNYAVEGSKCRDDDGYRLRDENTATCDTYGRLYDWATAMDLPLKCNESSCLSEITAKHKGLCPAGWHIPSDADWNVLTKFVNPSCYDNADCPDAGTKLKATSGWPNYYENSGNGTDDYGFSALPGGYGFNSGCWWDSRPGSRSMYNAGSVSRGGRSTEGLCSVRCIKD